MKPSDTARVSKDAVVRLAAAVVQFVAVVISTAGRLLAP